MEKKGFHLSIEIIFGFIFLTLLSCQRSPAFRRDQTYVQSEPPSYYNQGQGGGVSPTQRLEMMGQPKKRIAILTFSNDTPVKMPDLGPFAADELKRDLALTQRVLLPPDVQTELGTSDVLEGDRVKVAQLIREGRRLGVSVLVIGRLSKIVFRQRGDEVGLLRQKQSLSAVDIELKAFDVGSGREILSTAKSGEASNNAIVTGEGSGLESQEFRAELTKLGIRDAISRIAPDVIRSVEKMAWQGHVAKVNGGKIVVNAGKASGLVAGDILKVLSQGEDVYDPQTGAFLGRSAGQFKGTIEVTDFIGTDGAVTQIHTGGNFQNGDVVQLY